MNLLLLIGDQGFGIPRGRDSVATSVAASAPEDWLVFDRTVAKGSRAVADLALESMLDFDRLRSRSETAHLYVSMNVSDRAGTANPFDWLRRWMRILTTGERLGWSVRLVRLATPEDAPKEARRFDARIDRALSAAGLDSLVVTGIDWKDPFDPGSNGGTLVAQSILADLVDPDSSTGGLTVVRRSV